MFHSPQKQTSNINLTAFNMEEFDKSVAPQISLYKKILEYFTNFTNNYKDKMTAGAVKSRIRTYEKYWSTYVENDIKIQACKNAASEKHPYFTEPVYHVENLEEKYTHFVGEFLHLEDTLTRAENPAPPGPVLQHQPVAQLPAPIIPQANSTLPKVALPTFDGDQLQWESFKEIFQARVANDNTITNVIKLQHLLSCLKGNASKRLGSLQITAANYATAWDTLVRRYDNLRLRLSTHLNRLIDAQPANPKVPGELTRLLDTFEESIRALRVLQRPIDHWDDWFVQLLVHKLDYTTRTDWEKSREGNNDFPTYQDITNFIENRARTQEASRALNQANQSSNRPQGGKSVQSTKNSTSVHTTVAKPNGTIAKCASCNNENHFTFRCPKFLQMTVPQRRAYISSTGGCFNCFSGSHRAEKCPSKYSCRTCSSRHHTLLHLDITTPKDSSSPCITSSNPPSTNVSACTTSVGGRALMATALVTLNSGVNKMTVRALIDPGADESFISEHVAQLLQLKKSPVSTLISGVGGETIRAPTSLVEVTVTSSKDPTFSMKIPALVLKRLTNLLPSAQVQHQDWPHLRGLTLADPTFHKSGRIDCILGAEVYGVILLEGLRKGPHPSPTAQNTVFGWILTGSIENSSSCNSRVSCHLIRRNDPEDTLTNQLKRFWEIEEASTSVILSPEEEECEAHFQLTHFRDTDGRYGVRLPFSQKPDLPGNQEIAKSRLLSCERRLQSNQPLYEAYFKFLKEYEDLNHMEQVSPKELLNENTSYIPHHGIMKSDGSGKIRVVFNASQRSKSGKSLNDFLHKGPKLQSELLGVISRWRFFKYVFTADIVKMFRQFKVHQDDRDWQRILWRPSPNMPIQTYRLNTVTYGTAPAPYLAIRCLQQLANDERERFPKGAAILKRHSYVDDNFGGDHDLASVIQARDELIAILASAGMRLDKWAANNPSILPNFSSNALNTEIAFEEMVSTLGLKWKPHQDSFQFKVSVRKSNNHITKRLMLSEIASLFDPLGWLAPVIIRAKIYIQELWIRGKDWDVPVDEDLHEAWSNFKAQLPDIESISIPRWVFTSHNSLYELHGFSDASERAFAAAVYLVTCPNKLTHKSSLILAKTKVAPVQRRTIPQLELCGAQLLTRIIALLKEEVQIQPHKIHCWSDSKTVLAWVQGHPSRWKTFVANRVSEIVSAVPEAQWNHVETSCNPADLATRGATPTQLQQSTLWWHGPNWLQQGPASWPQPDEVYSTDEEKKSCTKIFQTSVEENTTFNWFSRYSSLSRLITHLSFIFRWKDNSKLPTGTDRIPSPSADHRKSARLAIIKATQRHLFNEDITMLEKGKSLKNSSHLRRLNPFIGTDGLLRVGGRLQNLSGTYDERYPVIVPKGSHLAQLLIREAHHFTLHGRDQLVKSTLRRHY